MTFLYKGMVTWGGLAHLPRNINRIFASQSSHRDKNIRLALRGQKTNSKHVEIQKPKKLAFLAYKKFSMWKAIKCVKKRKGPMPFYKMKSNNAICSVEFHATLIWYTFSLELTSCMPCSACSINLQGMKLQEKEGYRMKNIQKSWSENTQR